MARPSNPGIPQDIEHLFEPSFTDFGAVPELDDIHDEHNMVGRVIKLDRGYPLVATAGGSFRAEHAISLVKDSELRACVGDWVVLDVPDNHDKALIQSIIPRRTCLSRWDGRSRGQHQILAANVDLVLVVQPVSKRTISVDRVVRSAVIAHQGGMSAAVALTKCDRAGDEVIKADIEAIQRCLPDISVVATSSKDATGFEAIRELMPAGSSTLLLGESGAGKSTLINTLLGQQVLGTGAVRAKDDTGRHTTVARQMLRVPNAGLIVDAPGLRSLPLLDEDYGLAQTFPTIDALAPTCRFRDCSHGSEPGCAVRAAVEQGEVQQAQLEEYRQLVQEMKTNRMKLDPSAPQSMTSL